MIRDIEGAGAALINGMFLLEINGFKPFMVESFETPKAKFNVMELDGAGQTVTVFQAATEKIEEFEVTWIVYVKDNVIPLLEEWRKQVQTHDPAQYYRDGTISVLGPNEDPVLIGDIEDMWPPEPINVEKMDAKDKKEALKVTAKFRCNYFAWRKR